MHANGPWWMVVDFDNRGKSVIRDLVWEYNPG
jgi:hypothetical protein